MANLFLHRMPITNGIKFTIICSKDVAETVENFLNESFEIELLVSGKKTVLRSETRFEFDIEDTYKIQQLTKVFMSEKTLTEALFGVEVERNFPSELLDGLCLN